MIYLYIGGGIILVIIIALFAKKGSAKSDTPKLADLTDDLIYNPETGESMTLEDAMEEKAFNEEDAEDVYDMEASIADVFALIDKQYRVDIDLETTKVVLQVQNHYMLSSTAEPGSDDNLDFIKEIFANNQIEPPSNEILKAVISDEMQYLENKSNK